MIRNPVKAIRTFCLACVGNSPQEVRDCTATPDSSYPCPLYAFRFGKNPYRHSTMTEERRKEKSEQMKALRQKQLEKKSQ